MAVAPAGPLATTRIAVALLAISANIQPGGDLLREGARRRESPDIGLVAAGHDRHAVGRLARASPGGHEQERESETERKDDASGREHGADHCGGEAKCTLSEAIFQPVVVFEYVSS